MKTVEVTIKDGKLITIFIDKIVSFSEKDTTQTLIRCVGNGVDNNGIVIVAYITYVEFKALLAL